MMSSATGTGERDMPQTGYEREWREGITRSLDDSAKSHQATAVILERLKGQLDNHDARIKILEGAPTNVRASISTWAVIATTSFGAVGCLGTLLSMAALTLGGLAWLIVTLH